MELPRISREAAAASFKANLPKVLKSSLEESGYILKTLSNLQAEIQKELAGFPDPQAAWEIWKEEYAVGNRDSCLDRLFALVKGTSGFHAMGSLGEMIALKKGELDSILESVCLLEAKQDMLDQLAPMLGDTFPKDPQPGPDLTQKWGEPMRAALTRQLNNVLEDLTNPAPPAPKGPAVPKIPDINFGIEIEGFFLSDAPYETQKAFLEEVLAAADPQGKWEVTNDFSIKNPVIPTKGHGGLEVISPVLRGPDGMERAQAVMKTLQVAQFETNRSCGLHIHIESGRKLGTLKEICKEFLKGEDSWGDICPEHRLTNPTCTANGQAISRRSPGQSPEAVIEAATSRKALLEATQHSKHCRLNITPACSENKPPTVEFRLFEAKISPAALTPTLRAITLVDACIKKTREKIPKTDELCPA